jgi:hypothetical protein
MRRHDRFISAFEIGTWCYCNRAWYLQQLGHPSALRGEQLDGARYHQTHFQHLRVARRQRAVSRVVMLICFVLLVLLGIAGSWSGRW